jgi:K+-transporting ATPase ATPase C chain
MKSFLRQLRPAVLAIVVLTVLCGVIYPLAVTAVGQVAFNHRANGSIITVNGTKVGSELLGQSFVDAKYFHPRPSAAGAGYDGTASSGSNLGPTNPALLDAVKQRVEDYRTENDLAPTQLVPVDAVTSSASGLDPQITVANARLQAARVAKARGLSVDSVLAMVEQHTTSRPLTILGDPGVNVLQLNIALDAG